MRRAARITLFVQDRDGRLDTFPDQEVFNMLLQQTPLVNRNPDGSRTLVFDLANPASALVMPETVLRPDGDSLRAKISALSMEAHALGLPLTAALADSAELVAEVELGAGSPRNQPLS
jgi:hypothetical protein